MASENPVLYAAMLRWLDEFSNRGILTTDTQLRVRSWNKWLERESGRSAPSVIGQPIADAFPEIRARGLERYYEAALEGEFIVLAQPLHRFLIEIPVRGEGAMTKPMPQSCRIAPLVADGEIVGTITVVDDVSDRVNSELELRHQIASAERAREAAEEALRIKDEFLATLSHEIRTPLNAVVGWTRILLSRTVDRATLENALRVIDRNARAQSRLVEDMLDMARIVTGKLRLEMAPMDLVTATRAAIDVVAPAAAAKGVRIVPSLGRHPRPVIADADRVQQIAWNLLSNAVKFTPAGGIVDISIPDEPGPVRLIVSDSGQGIAPEFLPYVFERFRQANASTSRTEGGLGLGLALVRQLVELHGGHISAESKGRGRGSVFTVTFPEVKTEVATDQGSTGVLTGQPLAGIQVLLIDDDNDWRQLLSLGLEGLGATVLSAPSAHDGIELLQASEAWLPDVILADIGMPYEDGYQFVKRLQNMNAAFARVPVIAVTAYAGSDNETRALAAGFRMQCTKPLDSDAVARAVLKVVRNQPA
jgi:signal transduction histidine kinase/ActR/RegA family two-component response regulator